MYYELLTQPQNGDQDSMLELIRKFTPLLIKYARKLNYEDAFNDLRLAFLESVIALNTNNLKAKNDAVVVSYLSRSMQSRYVRLLKTFLVDVDAIAFSQLEEWQIPASGIDPKSVGDFSDIELSDIRKTLTDREYFVFFNSFIAGFTEVEIARKCSITRQAVCKTRKRVLKKLGEYVLEK